MGSIPVTEPVVDDRFDYGIYIGRFQPLHLGHETVIREALEKVKTLIVIVGSSGKARTPVNPFTFEDREAMFNLVFKHEITIGRLILIPLYDYADDYDWCSNLKIGVKRAILEHANNYGIGLHGLADYKIALAGYGKDASSYYLKMFPEWGSIQILTQHGTINASDVRYDFFRRAPRLPDFACSPHIVAWLRNFGWTNDFRRIVAEREQLAEDKAAFGTGPFLTADALVTWRKKVLLVTRGKAIGFGLLAMPGGFVEKGELFYDAALREAKEETGIEEIEDYYDGHMLADNPNRSLRGRVVSMVYHFNIPDEVELPAVEGRDDAAHAGWYDFDTLTSDRFFDDHFDLITEMLKEITL